MRNLKAISLVLSFVLLVSGCAQLPRSSEIQSGPDLKSGLTSDYLYYSPSGPTAGDDQLAIINGFLNAATGPQNDYSVAREYLSTNFQSKWNPSNEVLIQDSRPVLNLATQTLATLSVKPIASIDSVGIWTSQPTNTSRHLEYKLVKENNQWRISEAPNLTILVKPVFDVLFRSYSLFFFDGQNRYLVPDLRWFPSRVSTGTRLVNALIAGPNQWLAPAVNNSFPAGTKLAIDAVTVDGGVAVVDLNTAANKADKLQRSRMLSQLSATLNQLPSVYSVKIHIDHTPQDISLTNAQLPYSANQSLMLLKADGISNSTTSTVNEKATNAAKRFGARDFGFSPDLGYLALTSAKGAGLLRLSALSNELKQIDNRRDLLAPVIDVRTQTWTLGKSADASLNAYDSNGKLLLATSGWLSGGEHLAYGISREGSRLAVLLKTKDSTVAYVAAISRDALGNPTGLSNPRRIGVGLGTLQSLSWATDNSLVGYSVGATKELIPVTIFVGGGHNELSNLIDVRQVIAQSDSTSIYAIDRLGFLYEYRSMNWMLVDSDVITAHFGGN